MGIDSFPDGYFDSGDRDPRRMSLHFFMKPCLLHYETALRATILNQNFGYSPRPWYIDMTGRCVSCGEEFCWSATEQRLWFETYGFFVDAFAIRCLPCRREQRRVRELRQEYDQTIATALGGDRLEAKERLAEVIDRLCESLSELPNQIHENRKVLGRQIERWKRLAVQQQAENLGDENPA
jgi:hypothetical protein